MRRADHRPRRTLLAVLAACSAGLLVLSGCGTDQPAQNGTRMNEQQPSAQKGEPGPVRTDLDPLTKRFPALGEPVSASWQSGVLGDERAPGPASYWIDAVVVLQPAVAGSLRARPGLTGAEPPQLSPGAAASLPEARWLAAPELDAEFSGNGYAAQAYLAEDSDTVVLLAKGSG